MRIIQQKLYNYNELSEKSKQRVRLDLASDNWYGEHLLNDLIKSLKVLAEKIGGELDYNISLVPIYDEFIKITDFDIDVLNEIIDRRDDCPLTGCCYDVDILEHFNPETGDISDALKTLHKEYESMFENDYLLEYFDANEIEFFENGEMYK